jgi:hypothetical protein
VSEGFEEFTEDGYRQLVQLAASSYRFIGFPDAAAAGERSVLWRHDVDFSPHRAAALARIEAQEGAVATYFLLPHSAYYNLLEADVAARVEEIVALGHDLGVHFDPTFHAARGRPLDEALEAEADLVADLFGVRPRSFSLHNPDVAGWDVAADTVAGLVNAYAASLRARFAYCSDSNGYWRHRRLGDVLAHATDPRLHVLTHPEWWVPEPMSPRERVSRAIDGRARATHARYDEAMRRMGRVNVGVSEPRPTP